MTFYFSNALKSIADIKESVKILQVCHLLFFEIQFKKCSTFIHVT